MFCYKDQTWCPFYVDCIHAKDCSRQLTDKVKEDADKFGAPICQYSAPPFCHEKKVEEDKDE